MHLVVCATRGNNLTLSRAIKEIAQSLSLEIKVLCLEDFKLPVYTPAAEAEGVPEAALKITDEFHKAKSLILVAPEYNGSIPPIVNNTITWISRSGDDDWRASFNGKPCALGTHSGGGGFKVIQGMRSQLEHLGAIVLPRSIMINRHKQFNRDSVEFILKQLDKLTRVLP